MPKLAYYSTLHIPSCFMLGLKSTLVTVSLCCLKCLSRVGSSFNSVIHHVIEMKLVSFTCLLKQESLWFGRQMTRKIYRIHTKLDAMPSIADIEQENTQSIRIKLLSCYPSDGFSCMFQIWRPFLLWSWGRPQNETMGKREQ